MLRKSELKLRIMSPQHIRSFSYLCYLISVGIFIYFEWINEPKIKYFIPGATYGTLLTCWAALPLFLTSASSHSIAIGLSPTLWPTQQRWATLKPEFSSCSSGSALPQSHFRRLLGGGRQPRVRHHHGSVRSLKTPDILSSLPPFRSTAHSQSWSSLMFAFTKLRLSTQRV